MHNSSFLLTILFIAAISFSCKSDKQQQNDVKKAATVKHYYCKNNCEGSGSDVQGNCPVCKNPYAHNQAFHSNEFLQNGPIKIPSNAPLPNNAPTPINKPIEPAQNSLGVFHYTCTNGCAGGAGSATNCLSCGTLLEHNSIYHNN